MTLSSRTRQIGGWLTVGAIAALYVLDALILSQGFVALGLVVAVFGGLLPKWLLLGTRENVAARRLATARLGVGLLLCAVAIMVTINLNNQLAHERANELVAAIDHYRAVAGRYPARLDDLVPVYLDVVPRAKYTLSFNHFDFANGGERVVLAYADTPPFGRAVYDFNARAWSGLGR